MIGTIGCILKPEPLKLTLTNAIADPIKSGLRALLLDGVSGNAACGVVVRHTQWGLPVVAGARVLQWQSEGGRPLFAIMKQSTEFRLGSAGQDFTHDLAQNVHGTSGMGASAGLSGTSSQQRANTLWSWKDMKALLSMARSMLLV